MTATARKPRAPSGPRNPRRTLVSDKEIDRVFAKLKEYGVSIADRIIDIRTDGITLALPAKPAAEDAFSAWQQNKDSHRDGRPRRS